MRVLVTGAASGIGKATVEKLLEKGHTVIAVDIDGEALPSLPDPVTKYQADVYETERVEEIVEGEEFDAVVNSAGYYEQGAVEDVATETVESVFRANYFGPANVIRAAIPGLIEREGRIVNVSSVAGRVTVPFSGHYCASKHALEALSDALRMELHDTGVDVIVVEPGVIETGFNWRAREALRKYLPGSRHGDRYRRILENEGFLGTGPGKPAATIVRALESPHPRRRYQSPLTARLLVALEKITPTGLQDFVTREFTSY